MLRIRELPILVLIFTFFEDVVESSYCYYSYYYSSSYCYKDDYDDYGWLVGAIIGGIIAFIFLVSIIVLVICLIIKKNSGSRGTVISPAGPSINMTSVNTSSHHPPMMSHFQSGPQPMVAQPLSAGYSPTYSSSYPPPPPSFY